MPPPPRHSAKPSVLPQLPFGDSGAESVRDIKTYGDRMATVITSLNEYRAIGNPAAFESKALAIRINGMKVVASANTPVTVDIGSSDDVTLMIPFAGKNITTVGRTEHCWQTGQGAMFIPAMGRGGSSTTRASLMLDLDRRRLEATARAMLGLAPESDIDLRLSIERILNLQTGGNNFDAMFRHLCAVIDSVHCNEDVLSVLGVDELFNRIIVMMLRPDLFVDDDSAGEQHPSRRMLDPVCDYVLANLHERITLSDLEQISGRSARNLQNVFLQRFGCSPMQWVREERLLMARRLLERSAAGETITAISHACGFANPATFARYYRNRFGELPSDTLSRRTGG